MKYGIRTRRRSYTIREEEKCPALNSLMTILGPLWAGIVYDRVMLGSPYWMGAVIFAAAAFLLMRVTAVKVPETTVTHG